MFLLFFIFVMFNQPENFESFQFNSMQSSQFMIVNDVVMGGRSNSELKITSDSAIYQGKLSLENNGGFASVRMIWPFNSKSLETEPSMAILKIKGDGLIYQFRLRTNQGFDGAAYSYSFSTIKNQVQTIYIPINSFIPTYRGRTLRNMPKLKFSDVQQMGVLVADKQVGDFSIDLIEMSIQ